MRNRSRDEDVNRLLVASGWHVVRVWDFDLEHDTKSCIGRAREALEGARTASAAVIEREGHYPT